MLNTARTYSVSLSDQNWSYTQIICHQAKRKKGSVIVLKYIITLSETETKKEIPYVQQRTPIFIDLELADSLPTSDEKADLIRMVPNNVFLKKLNDVFEVHAENATLSVNQVAAFMQMSYSKFNRKLKALTRLTPIGYLRQFRLKKAKSLLSDPAIQLNVSQIAYRVGFTDPNYFSRCFTEFYGQPPNVIRRSSNS